MTHSSTVAAVPVDEARAALQRVRAEVAKAVVGQDAALAGLLVALLSQGHVLMEGVPGVAKTLLVRTLAATLDVGSKRVQFTPDLMPGDITGSMMYDAHESALTFRRGPLFTNLLLADEINRTPPKTQSALLEAMEEGQVSVDGVTHPLPRPFLVAATQNPIEYQGTYPLPEAQLDRFLLKVTLSVPGRDDEVAILRRHADGFDPRDLVAVGVRPVASAAHLQAAADSVREVQVSPEVCAYVVDVARATRDSPSVSLGVSPRGATALLRTSRAWAWLNDRDFVTPDDVKALAHATLAHRLTLQPAAELEGVEVARVLNAVVESVPVPPVSITGRVPLLLLVGVLAVAVRPVESTAWLWVLAVAGLTLLDVALAAAPKGIHLDRAPLAATREGATTWSRLLVRNDGRRTARGVLRDAWQPTAGAVDNRHRLDVGPGGSVVVSTELAPGRRGALRADRVTIRTRGPLGFGCRQRSLLVPGSFRSLPAFDSRKHLPSRLAALRELDGRSAVRTRGQGTEFDSLREYVRGDDVRSIDWRATARSRTTVVRTWQPERDRRVVLVLDTSRSSAARVGEQPRLEASMEAALLLAALAARAGDRVDFVAGDTRVRAQARSGARQGLLPGLMTAMSDLEPVLVEADWSRLAGRVGALSRQRALVVLLSALEPSVVMHGLLPVLPELVRHHQVVLASVRDPSMVALARPAGRHVREAYAAAAAERSLTDRDHAAELLRVMGVAVVDAEPEELPVALTDHYLLLKARGLL